MQKIRSNIKIVAVASDVIVLAYFGKTLNCCTIFFSINDFLHSYYGDDRLV